MQGAHQIPAKAGMAHSEVLSRDLRLVPWNVPLSCFHPDEWAKWLWAKKKKKKNLPFGNCTKSWIENSILDVIGAFLDWQRPREFIFILGKKKKKRHEFSANRCVIEPAPGTQHTGELNSSCWQPNVSFLSGHKRRRMNPRLKSFPSYGIVPLCKGAEIVRQAD